MYPHRFPHSPVPSLPGPYSSQVGPQDVPVQALQGPRHPFDSQHSGGTSAALIRAMTTHFDTVFAATQNALLTRISTQDIMLAKQQESLDSITRSITAMRAEFAQTQESLKIDMYDMREKMDKLGNRVADSMKRLATGTLKALDASDVKSRERWGRVEESLESLREEIKDPHADDEPLVRHEVAVGSDSPMQKPVYQDVGIARTPLHSFSTYEPYESGMHADIATPGHMPVHYDTSNSHAPSESTSIHSPEMTPSSEQAAKNLVSEHEGMETEHSFSSLSSLGSNESLCASVGSTLPDPSSLLLPPERNSHSKQYKPPTPGPLVPAARQRSDSLSSLSTLSSIDMPILETVLPEETPGRRSKATSNGKGDGSSTNARKRRRSSPIPAQGKLTKRTRTHAQTGTTKKVKKELLNSHGGLREKGNMKKSVPWPKKTAAKEAGSRQFIQCDKCDLWYHWGCVGIRDNDPRLEDEMNFLCPPCRTNSLQHAQERARTEQRETCSRPDCDIEDDVVEEFFIEKIIGRVDHKKAGLARFSWLIKWEGYPTEQATWTPEGQFPNAKKLIEDFKSAAEINGMRIPGKSLTLLPEAVEAGWNVKRE